MGSGAFSSMTSLFFISLIALLLGVSVACFRTGGIILGQKITPAESLHLVVSSSDSIARFWTGVLTIVYGWMIGANLDNRDIIISCTVAIVAAFCAQRVYLSICKKHQPNPTFYI